MVVVGVVVNMSAIKHMGVTAKKSVQNLGIALGTVLGKTAKMTCIKSKGQYAKETDRIVSKRCNCPPIILFRGRISPQVIQIMDSPIATRQSGNDVVPESEKMQ
jgi:hypothetical protein